MLVKKQSTRMVERCATGLVLAALLVMSGCSTLGISLYPATTALTTDAKEVLDATRVPQGVPRENAMTVLPPHALHPGDSVLVEPLQFDRDLRLPADQIVLADGTIDLGPFGRVVVVGHSLEQVESLIETQIATQLREQMRACEPGATSDTESSFDPPLTADDCDNIAVNVRLLEPVHQFYVLGEVNAPGAFPLTGDETVLDAIVGAGGLTSSANPCQILLARPTDPNECRVTLPVCYREIVQLGNTATNYQLQPGDRVFVPSRSCLDEWMFWKASRTCERCRSCNKPCKHPSYVTFKPMTQVAETMIPPGSKGWSESKSASFSEAGLLESSEFDMTGQAIETSLEDVAPPVVSEPVPLSSDADGQLDFPPR